MKAKSPNLIAYAGGLIIDHLFALLAALLTSNIINFFSTDGIPVLNLIISATVYFLICYVDAWNRGNTDSNRIRLGIMPDNKFRGVLAGLIAAIPGGILALLATVAELGIAKFYDVFAVDLFTALNRVWHLPLGTLYLFVNENPFGNFLFPLFIPVVSGFGYVMGLKEISLKYIFVYRNREEEDSE